MSSLKLVAETPVFVPPFPSSPPEAAAIAVLKRMRRKYSRREYLTVVEKGAEQDSRGGHHHRLLWWVFPGETAVRFPGQQGTWLKGLPSAKMHVFQIFPPGRLQAAARFPEQIPAEVKEERSKCLIKIGEEAARSFPSVTGRARKVRVLVETGGKRVSVVGQH